MTDRHEVTINPATVTVRPADLFEAFCVALESGEFRQITGAMYDEGNGRCAWGVWGSLMGRAFPGMVPPVVPGWPHLERAAAYHLGYPSLAHANDAGVPFADIAAALRQARQASDSSE